MERGQHLRQGDDLTLELRAAFELEPVGAGADLEAQRSGPAMEPTVGLDVPAFADQSLYDLGQVTRAELQAGFVERPDDSAHTQRVEALCASRFGGGVPE